MQARSASEPFRHTYGDIQGVDANMFGPVSQPALYTPGREVRFRHSQLSSPPGQPTSPRMHQTNLPVVREDGDSATHLSLKSFEAGEESAHISTSSSHAIQAGPGQVHGSPLGSASSGVNTTTRNISKRAPPSYRTQLSEHGSLRRPRHSLYR